MGATPVVEPVSEEPVQGVAPANADNLLATRQPIIIAEEPVTLLTHSDIESLIKQENGSRQPP